MADMNESYTVVRDAARDLLKGAQASRTIEVGATKILVSKVRVLEANEPMPAPYPKTDLPQADDYSSWLN
jgi:hypothetical protein